VGVLSDSDIVAASAERPLILARRIERAQSVNELAEARANFPRVTQFLIDGGVSGAMVGRLLAETNDRLVRRVLELAEVELGPPPTDYCWVVMGSEGRRDQTLRTDQDNGLIYSEDADADAVGYFERLAEWTVSRLEQTGASRCPGDNIATNPLWCGTPSRWQSHFDNWLHERDPAALLHALIALDFRPVAGALGLATDLRAWLVARTPSAHRFLGHVAHVALQVQPPLNLFGNISLPRSGPHAEAFDVKHHAVRPIVDACRLLALEHGSAATETLTRLEAARERGAVPAGDARDLRAAFEALQELRLRAQLQAIQAGKQPDNYLSPKALVRAERAGLREHLHAISHFQDAIKLRYAVQLRAV
jgi:CBS domain-containing protein